ncbi:GOLPH3/VPS74 family protein [Micromonospora sp. DT44]|uniref:GOLPH3/VPS74 family protein n=1 Tax=Micromonospora sp. DT44 TaxID=3393439 RepID=UPI003CF2C418
MNAPDGAAHQRPPRHVEPDTFEQPTQVISAVPARPVRLADEFFLVAHHDQTGRPRLHDAGIGLGLAAALLLELHHEGRVTFDRGQLRVRDSRPPADALQHLVLDRLVAESQHTATQVWLAFVADSAAEQVAQRLWQAGKVQPTQVRRLWRSSVVYVPTDINAAAWPWARLSYKLRRYEQLDPFDLALAGLVMHTGLDRYVLDGAPYATGAHLRGLLDAAWPALRDLLADLGTAIGNSVLTHRT